MASLSVRYAGGPESSVYCRGISLHPPSRNQKPPSMVTTIGNGNKYMIPISMSLSRMDNLVTNRKKQKGEEAVSYENVIDEWMKDSVVEIVKNLREAPLLVHVYSDDGDSARLKTEKAVSEDWPLIKSKWENGTTPLPEGVIFVEQLKNEGAEVESDSTFDFGRESESETTRAWGIVVQAKGETCGPACYLLKTSRAGPLAGLGLCCTHFCLMKVKSFRESAEAQFNNSWLLNGH